LKGVSADQKDKAAAALRRYYAQLEETPPDLLKHHGILIHVDDFQRLVQLGRAAVQMSLV
jgi:hypothetical protein